MPINFTITPPTPEDAFDIRNVMYKTWLATYVRDEYGVTVEDVEESYKDLFTEESVSRFKEALKNIPENQNRLVARVGGKVVGISTLIKKEEHNQLQTMYILPEFQGQGIGTAFWENHKKFLDPRKETIVHTAVYNTLANNFYKKLGFVDTGKRFTEEKGRMKSGAVILEMEMRLEDK